MERKGELKVTSLYGQSHDEQGYLLIPRKRNSGLGVDYGIAHEKARWGILSSEHYDHLPRTQWGEIDIPVYTTDAVVSVLQILKRGEMLDNIRTANPYEAFEIGNLGLVTLIPFSHNSPSTGLILERNGVTIIITADTGAGKISNKTVEFLNEKFSKQGVRPDLLLVDAKAKEYNNEFTEKDQSEGVNEALSFSHLKNYSVWTYMKPGGYSQLENWALSGALLGENNELLINNLFVSHTVSQGIADSALGENGKPIERTLSNMGITIEKYNGNGPYGNEVPPASMFVFDSHWDKPRNTNKTILLNTFGKFQSPNVSSEKNGRGFYLDPQIVVATWNLSIPTHSRNITEQLISACNPMVLGYTHGPLQKSYEMVEESNRVFFDNTPGAKIIV